MPKYVSPKEYKRLNPELGLGEEAIKRGIKNGTIKGQIVQSPYSKYPHYKVEVEENEKTFYSKEYVAELQRKLGQYEEKLRMINSVSVV